MTRTKSQLTHSVQAVSDVGTAVLCRLLLERVREELTRDLELQRVAGCRTFCFEGTDSDVFRQDECKLQTLNKAPGHDTHLGLTTPYC